MKPSCLLLLLLLGSVCLGQVAEDMSALKAKFQAANQEFYAERSKAIKARVPRSEWPKSPVKEFYPKFEKLVGAADKGSSTAGEGLAWMLRNARGAETDRTKLPALKRKIVARMLKEHIDQTCMLVVAQNLQRPPRKSDANSIDYRKLFIESLDLILEKNSHARVRAQSLFSKANALAGRSMPSTKTDQENAVKALETLRLEHGDQAVAKRAKGFIFELKNLQIGMKAPDFDTEDVDGVTFKLSDYQGKVVVIDFWGFW